MLLLINYFRKKPTITQVIVGFLCVNVFYCTSVIITNLCNIFYLAGVITTSV